MYDKFNDKNGKKKRKKCTKRDEFSKLNSIKNSINIDSINRNEEKVIDF